MKSEKSTAEKHYYVGIDNRLHKYGQFPTVYTGQALLGRVQANAEKTLPYASLQIELVMEVKEVVKWGTITRAQARGYCHRLGLPRPTFPEDLADALEILEKEAAKAEVAENA